MLNYQKTVQAFDLNTVANHLLSGSIDALNACYECCDRYADSERIAYIGMARMVEKNSIPLAS